MLSKKIRSPFIMTVTGPKRTGKTTFIRDLVKQNLSKEFRYIIVMSATCDLSGDFDFVKEIPAARYSIVDSSFTDKCAAILEKLEAKQRNGMQQKTLLILDDLATDPILNPKSILDSYCIRHRHVGLSIIVVGHALRGTCGLPKALRSQIDYNIIFNPASMTEMETILKEALMNNDLREAKNKIKEVFSVPYNFIMYEPAKPYYEKMMINAKTPLISPNGENKRTSKSDNSIDKIK